MGKKYVYIIGGDHHNTLAVIRSFGKNKIPFKLLVHSNNYLEEPIISKSKYVKEYEVVDDNSDKIYKWLDDNSRLEKVVLFPCSDLAAYTIDNNYEILSKKYIIPGFKDKPGRVVELMDKKRQNVFAIKNKINCAKSWLIDLNNKIAIKNIIFPCIIKPNVSAYGNKSDIEICSDRRSFLKCIENYKKNGYKNVIVQEFINKEYEVCAFGCILKNYPQNIGCVIKKVRENPPRGGGSLTFAKFINNDEINNFLNNIISLLYKEGYNGLYDIELLVCKNKIYLNEINFRHSGNGYSSIDYGIDAPYIWYMNVCNNKIDMSFNKKIKSNTRFYFMDESNEIKLLKNKHISFFQFLGDVFKTKSFARFKLCDLKVFLAYLKKRR